VHQVDRDESAYAEALPSPEPSPPRKSPTGWTSPLAPAIIAAGVVLVSVFFVIKQRSSQGEDAVDTDAPAPVDVLGGNMPERIPPASAIAAWIPEHRATRERVRERGGEEGAGGRSERGFETP